MHGIVFCIHRIRLFPKISGGAGGSAQNKQYASQQKNHDKGVRIFSYESWGLHALGIESYDYIFVSKNNFIGCLIPMKRNKEINRSTYHNAFCTLRAMFQYSICHTFYASN
jgi:hypothetical protein